MLVSGWGNGREPSSSGKVRAMSQDTQMSLLYATSWHQQAVRDGTGHARWKLSEVTCQRYFNLLLKVGGVIYNYSLSFLPPSHEKASMVSLCPLSAEETYTAAPCSLGEVPYCVAVLL